jgi:hypothetical protein
MKRDSRANYRARVKKQTADEAARAADRKRDEAARIANCKRVARWRQRQRDIAAWSRQLEEVQCEDA